MQASDHASESSDGAVANAATGAQSSGPQSAGPETAGPKTADHAAVVRKRSVVDVLVDRIDDRGRGVSDHIAAAEPPAEPGVLQRPFSMRFANPGATVRARSLGRRKSRIDGHVLEVLDAGPHAAEPRCPHAGVCGGCALPTLAYAEQLRQKERLVQASVQRAFDDAELPLSAAMAPIVPANELEGYRNKMDFTFGSRRYVLADEPEGVDASFGLGLHAPGLYQKVLDVEHCAIAFDGASAIVQTARELALEHGITPWDLRDHDGLLRHLVLRRGARTGDLMVNLVTSERAEDTVDAYARAILARHPEITTFVQNVTSSVAKLASGEQEYVLHGSGTIDDELCGKRFRISADSFFQTNTAQAETLFQMVERAAALKDGDVLFDLYCGAGTIGLAVGERAARIVGIESVPSAVRDARRNAEANGVQNATFHEGDALQVLAELRRDLGFDVTPDVVIVDPPRAGLHPKVPTEILELGAPRIVYVSCNPKTGSRDVATLVAGGYRLVSVEPVDMFPHTPHVEAIFTLERAPGVRPIGGVDQASGEGNA